MPRVSGLNSLPVRIRTGVRTLRSPVINGKHVITLYISRNRTSRGVSPHDDLSIRLIMYARKEAVRDWAPSQQKCQCKQGSFSF